MNILGQGTAEDFSDNPKKQSEFESNRASLQLYTFLQSSNKDNLDEALRLANTATQIYEDNGHAWSALGTAKIVQSDYVRSYASQFDIPVRDEDMEPEEWNEAAENAAVLEARKDLDAQAVRHLKRANGLCLNDFDVLNNLVVALKRVNRNSEAGEYSKIIRNVFSKQAPHSTQTSALRTDYKYLS